MTDSLEQLLFDTKRLRERAYRLEVSTVRKSVGDSFGDVERAIQLMIWEEEE